MRTNYIDNELFIAFMSGFNAGSEVALWESLTNPAYKNKLPKTMNNNYPETRKALDADLRSKGYVPSPPTERGYVVYKHSNGSRVNVKPTGEVIPTIRLPKDPSNTEWNAPKYNQRTYYNGTPIPDELNTHSTGHFVEPLSK